MASDPTKPWGPDNPHPLSTMKTELVWEGKYDEYGNRRPVRLPDFPLVLQKIETVDAPRDAARAEQPGLFDEAEFSKSAHRDDFRNMLIWGDNKLVCAALLKEFRGKIDLIYIDPPFDVGADFTMDVRVGQEAEVRKEQSAMEAVAYRDTWGGGQDSYLHMLADRLTLMHELLASSGHLAVHLDHRVVHYCKLICDGLFGRDNFLNEVVWWKGREGGASRSHSTTSVMPTEYQSILLYCKHKGTRKWNPPLGPYKRSTVSRIEVDQRGWFYTRGRMGRRPAQWEREAGVSLKTYVCEDVGLSKEEVIERITAADARYVAIGDVWDRSIVSDTGRVGYATEKPESLVARFVEAATAHGDLVADFFCGSGTTMAVAEKLGRRWIGCDLGRYAIHTTRKRLIGVQRELHAAGKPYRSFDLYNLGRYERQWWQIERLQGADEQHRATVLKFFRAAPLETSPSPLLHGTKGGAYVHVDGIDSIMTAAELREVAEAAKAAGAKRVICLAWEFEMDIRLRSKALERELDIEIALKYIPREIMEANRNEVQFFDAAAVEAEAFTRKHPESGKPAVDVRLTNFLPSLTEVPEKELEALRERAVKSPFDFIDFWAVDFEHRDDKPFEHHWQDYRTRKDRSLKIESDCYYVYPSKGKKRICVKVIDVFGVDTTTVIEVQV